MLSVGGEQGADPAARSSERILSPSAGRARIPGGSGPPASQGSLPSPNGGGPAVDARTTTTQAGCDRSGRRQLIAVAARLHHRTPRRALALVTQSTFRAPGFFRSLEVPPASGDGGFLPNVETDIGRAFAKDSRRLDELLQHRCLVILGEPAGRQQQDVTRPPWRALSRHAGEGTIDWRASRIGPSGQHGFRPKAGRLPMSLLQCPRQFSKPNVLETRAP